nr:hypothetical protein CFP56_07615 [Quercus suber]
MILCAFAITPSYCCKPNADRAVYISGVGLIEALPLPCIWVISAPSESLAWHILSSKACIVKLRSNRAARVAAKSNRFVRDIYAHQAITRGRIAYSTAPTAETPRAVNNVTSKGRMGVHCATGTIEKKDDCHRLRSVEKTPWRVSRFSRPFCLLLPSHRIGYRSHRAIVWAGRIGNDPSGLADEVASILADLPVIRSEISKRMNQRGSGKMERLRPSYNELRY